MSFMSESRISLVFSVLGVAISLGAIYLTYQQMTFPFQQQLYTKQLDVVVDLMSKSQDLARIATSFNADDPSLGGLEIPEMSVALKSYEESIKSASVVLPAAIYRYATAVNGAAREMSSALRDCRDTSDTAQRLDFSVAVFYMMSRAFVGADPLSMKTVDLYGSKAVLNLEKRLINEDSGFGRYLKSVESFDDDAADSSDN